jgi:hypothetical protein
VVVHPEAVQVRSIPYVRMCPRRRGEGPPGSDVLDAVAMAILPSTQQRRRPGRFPDDEGVPTK